MSPTKKPQTPPTKATTRTSSREASSGETSLTLYSGTPTVFSASQIEQLSASTPEHAKRHRPGGGGKSLTYVPHGYVTGKLNQVFGYDWDFILLPVFDGSIVKQVDIYTPLSKSASPVMRERALEYQGRLCAVTHNLSVYGQLTVRVRNTKGAIVTTITKPGVGSSIWHEENEYGDAVKSAKSDALKVAAHEIGIALDLYWDEDAEFDKFEQQQEEAQEALELAAMPSTIVELITRAQTDYGLNGVGLQTRLGLTTTQLFGSPHTTEEIRNYWKQLGGDNAKASVS